MRNCAWVAGVLLCSSVEVLAASFPCHKASSYAELAVCADPELSRQDEELAELYQDALTRLHDPKAVRWAQKAWLEDDRDRCDTVQCVKDSYSKRIFALRRQLGEPTPLVLSAPRTATMSEQVGPSDEDCASLNDAVKVALNSEVPSASLTQFGGRVVTGWRQADYDDFLGALDTCGGRAEIAPELNVFPDEARLLLTTLRARAVRIGTTERNELPTAAVESIAPQSVDATQDIEDWQFVHNANGVVMASTRRNAVIYLGKSCDAMSPQYGNGTWSYGNAGWGVKVGGEQFNFPRAFPPIEDASGHPPPECTAGSAESQIVAASASASQVQLAAPAAVARPNPPAPPTSTSMAPTAAIQQSRPETVAANYFAMLLVVWSCIVIVGIVCGFNGTIIVYRNFDDLAIVFFMGALLFVGGLAGVYFSGFKDSFATPLLWGLSILGTMTLFGWTIVRTWRDQRPASAWRFALALTTKMSLGILFVNNLVTLLSPSGKTLSARSRARGTALLSLAVLTPIVMRLVRDHEGVWAPHNLLGSYHRRRMGI